MQRAIVLQPDSPSMHLQSAWMLWELQLFADAQQACNKALELAPDDAGALHLRDLLTAKLTSPNQA